MVHVKLDKFPGGNIYNLSLMQHFPVVWPCLLCLLFCFCFCFSHYLVDGCHITMSNSSHRWLKASNYVAIIQKQAAATVSVPLMMYFIFQLYNAAYNITTTTTTQFDQNSCDETLAKRKFCLIRLYGAHMVNALLQRLWGYFQSHPLNHEI